MERDDTDGPERMGEKRQEANSNFKKARMARVKSDKTDFKAKSIISASGRKSLFKGTNPKRFHILSLRIPNSTSKSIQEKKRIPKRNCRINNPSVRFFHMFQKHKTKYQKHNRFEHKLELRNKYRNYVARRQESGRMSCYWVPGFFLGNTMLQN